MPARHDSGTLRQLPVWGKRAVDRTLCDGLCGASEEETNAALWEAVGQGGFSPGGRYTFLHDRVRRLPTPLFPRRGAAVHLTDRPRLAAPIPSGAKTHKLIPKKKKNKKKKQKAEQWIFEHREQFKCGRRTYPSQEERKSGSPSSTCLQVIAPRRRQLLAPVSYFAAGHECW